MTHWIQDYIDLVRSGKYAVCEDQRLLCDMVERELSSGAVYVNEKQLEKYLSYQKYFPYKLFPWEIFCFALHNCVYRKDNDQLRWPMLMIYIGRGGGKNGYLAFEDFCLLTSTNGVQKYNIDIFAMSEKQAKASWQDVYDVLEANEAKMKKHFRWTKEVIVNTDTNSEFCFNTSSPKTKEATYSEVTEAAMVDSSTLGSKYFPVSLHLQDRCKCGPVVRLPVLPLTPIFCPALTRCPLETSILDRCRNEQVHTP